MIIYLDGCVLMVVDGVIVVVVVVVSGDDMMCVLCMGVMCVLFCGMGIC